MFLKPKIFWKETRLKIRSYPRSDYLVSLARRAGEIMRKNFRLGMERKLKSDNTPVTEADIAINQLVIDSICRDYPQVRVIGEEGSYEPGDHEFTLLCDPIDGTIPFCRGIPISAFVAAVIKGNQPLTAVIYDPFMDRLWHAEKGQGAFLNDQPVTLSKHNTLKLSNICVVWWRKAPYNLHRVCEQLVEAEAGWMNPASIAYVGGLVASGEFEATIFPGHHGWETAAMQLIVEEAGGRATDIHGQPLQYGPRGEIEGHIISNGHFHDELVELVRSCQ